LVDQFVGRLGLEAFEFDLHAVRLVLIVKFRK